MSSPTKAELLEENRQLRAHNELLAAAVSQDVTIRELSAKMDDDGSMNVQIISGERGISHPGIRVLAAAALSLLEIDGTVPPNYRTAEMSGKLASGETYFVEVAACKSKNQTPHKLRMKAEAERDALAVKIREVRSRFHQDNAGNWFVDFHDLGVIADILSDEVTRLNAEIARLQSTPEGAS